MKKNTVKKHTRKTLVDAIYQEIPANRKIVEQTVALFLEQLAHVLKSGDSVELRGLGVFQTRTRRQKRRYDFATGKVINDEALVRYVSFMASSTLRSTKGELSSVEPENQ